MEQNRPSGGSEGFAMLVLLVVLAGGFLVVNQVWLHWFSLPSMTGAAASPSPSPPASPGRPPPEGDYACDLGDTGTERQESCKQAKAYAATRIKAMNMVDAGCDADCQWVCLNELWYRESRWSAWAVNPGSQAYGIAQILPEAHGHPKGTELGNWRGQVDWGMTYIKGRYHTPCAALAFWKSPKAGGNWY